jgi:hypothetical protein
VSPVISWQTADVSSPISYNNCFYYTISASGGFLARDWSDHSPVGELQRRSFDLHAELAKDLGEKVLDYRRLEAAAVALDEAGGMASKSGKKLEGVEWADVNVRGARMLGGMDTIAQVSCMHHYYLFHLRCTLMDRIYIICFLGTSKETEQCIVGILAAICWVKTCHWYSCGSSIG